MHVWKTPATMDAANCLSEFSAEMTDDSIPMIAEDLAIDRSKLDGYDPTITSGDVLRAVIRKLKGDIEALHEDAAGASI